MFQHKKKLIPKLLGYLPGPSHYSTHQTCQAWWEFDRNRYTTTVSTVRTIELESSEELKEEKDEGRLHCYNHDYQGDEKVNVGGTSPEVTTPTLNSGGEHFPQLSSGFELKTKLCVSRIWNLKNLDWFTKTGERGKSKWIYYLVNGRRGGLII